LIVRAIKKVVRAGLGKLPPRLRLPLETGVLYFLQRALFEARARAPAAAVRAYREPQSQLARDWEREVRSAGYVIIPGFKSQQWCAEARREALAAMGDASRVTRHKEDVRVFGIESISPKAREFAADPLLAMLACVYAGSDEALLFCMANKVEYRPQAEYGSGGEWHRDSFKRELKAMLYLTDVTASDGPFSIVRGSHRHTNIIADVVRLSVRRGPVPTLSATRLKDAGDFLRSREPHRTVRAIGSAGTLLLFDGSAIHTGSPPLPDGKPRIALTTYYSTRSELESIREYYRPFVRINGDPAAEPAHAADCAR